MCIVDHNSITSRLLINDGGAERTRCPACLVMVEPGVATGVVTGRPSGRGRGYLTERHKAELRAVKREAEFCDWLDAR